MQEIYLRHSTPTSWSSPQVLHVRNVVFGTIILFTKPGTPNFLFNLFSMVLRLVGTANRKPSPKISSNTDLLDVPRTSDILSKFIPARQ